MSHEVFVSYRRSDASGHAGRICDDLERLFGRAVAFRDVESIDAGADFVAALERAIAAARVCIVLIGDTWLSATLADGTRRLDAAADHVRREIELALDAPGVLVLPVLVEGARMPGADELPPSLQRLARLQGVELSETRWDYDMRRLAVVIGAAGVVLPARERVPRWALTLLALLAAVLLVVAVLCWRGGTPTAGDYTGLWYLPNGSYWTVRETDDGLWVEETHHDSQQVWKRGAARLDDGMHASLELVFERESFRYLHQLSLSDDRQSLIGQVRRSDRDAERSVVLTRSRQN